MMELNEIIAAARKHVAEFPYHRLPERLEKLTPDILQDKIMEYYAIEILKRRFTPNFGPALETMHSLANWMCKSTKSGLMLFGPVGTGKTTILKAMYRLFEKGLISSYNHISYIPAVTIHEAAQKGDLETMQQIERVEYLFIDDIGHEPQRCVNFGVDLYPVEDIICRRYENRRMTIFSTNLDRAAIHERYGDRLADRISEEYDMILFDGINYRKQH